MPVYSTLMLAVVPSPVLHIKAGDRPMFGYLLDGIWHEYNGPNKRIALAEVLQNRRVTDIYILFEGHWISLYSD
jgi:hypothetical protein